MIDSTLSSESERSSRTNPAMPADPSAELPPMLDADTAQTESMFDLVARAQAGDRVALDELLVRSLPVVHRWAHGRLPMYARGALDTDDLVQQAAYQTLKRLHLFEPRHVYSLQAYLREAVVNRIRDAVRRQVRRGLADNVPDPLPSIEERRDEHSPSPLEELLKQETVERYRRALKMLKPEEQRAVVLRLELEIDYEELAEQLDKPSAAAARMAAKRALEKLAKVLKDNP